MINSARINAFRFSALVMAMIATTAWAQDNNAAAANNAGSWRENAIARCTQQYSAEQCQDDEFLEANFHVNSLEVAHRAAMQRNQQEKKALRELTLQRICSISAGTACASDANIAQCTAQVEQSCVAFQAEADNCAQSAQQTCANEVDPNACYQRRTAQCPSFKKQPIEQLLAKYPRLSAAQKSRLIAAAAELDAKTGGLWSNLVEWLKTPFR